VYVSPRPGETELRRLYATYHRRGGKTEDTWAALMRDVFRESAGILQAARNGGGSGRLLDIGCGFGGFVALMRGRGWEAEGLDPSPEASAAGAAKGIPVRLGTLREYEAPPGSFDAVTLFYVLEHLHDPMGALRKAHGLLAPGGTLLVRVPDTTPIVALLSPFGRGASLYDAPFHLYDFPPPVLRAMLRKTGFERIRTFPGKPTRPARAGERAAALLPGALARCLYAASGGKILLPGVSKTTIARKPG